MNLILHSPVLVIVSLGLFVGSGIAGMAWLGHRSGRRFLNGVDRELHGLGIVEGAIFGLFGLIVAFTFTGAADRFQDRKALILNEAQAVSTAYARLDLLGEAERLDLRARFRVYLELRLEAYSDMGDYGRVDERLAKAEAQGREIWTHAAGACRRPENAVYSEIVLPPINEMLDVAAARTAALNRHPPMLIFVLLVGLSLLCGFLAGFAMSRSPQISRCHVAMFTAIIAVTLCVTLDLEHPRAGLIRVDSADTRLVNVLNSMR